MEPVHPLIPRTESLSEMATAAEDAAVAKPGILEMRIVQLPK